MSQSASEKSSRALKTFTVFGTDGTLRVFQRPAVPNPINADSCAVYFVEAATPAETSRESFSEFDGLLKSLEDEEASATELREGRKWVANAFYGERPTLASLRLSAGMSQKQLGEACGIEQPHVSRYESGKHEPSLTTAVCMARALGVGLDVFSDAWANTRSSVQVERTK